MRMRLPIQNNFVFHFLFQLLYSYMFTLSIRFCFPNIFPDFDICKGVKKKFTLIFNYLREKIHQNQSITF